jgi:hypothetical protein
MFKWLVCHKHASQPEIKVGNHIWQLEDKSLFFVMYLNLTITAMRTDYALCRKIV